MKKIQFFLIVFATACVFQIAGFETIANAAWGEDVLVTNYIPDYDSLKPSMAAAPNGDLYIAVEDVMGMTRVYKSTDGGETWEWEIVLFSGGYLKNPSLTYGAGSENWVLIIFEDVVSDTSRYIRLFRFDPANPSTNSDWAIIAYDIYMPAGVHIKPEICTDAYYWPDACDNCPNRYNPAQEDTYPPNQRMRGCL